MSQIKITLAKAVELLKAAGVPVAEIVTDEAQATPEYNMDTALSQIDTARKPIIRQSLEAELKDTVAKAASGKTAGTFKSAIARAFSAAGVTRNELDAFDKEDDMMAAVLGKYNAFAGKDTDALRKQLEDMSTKHADEVKKVKTEWEGKVAAEQAKYIGRDIEEYLAGVTTKIPRIGGDAIAQAKMLKADLESRYHLHFNPETKKLELRDKTNNELPALNEAKTQTLQAEDLAKTFYTNLGIVKTDNRNDNPMHQMQQHQQHLPGNPQQQQQFNPASPQLDPVEAANQAMLAELGAPAA